MGDLARDKGRCPVYPPGRVVRAARADALAASLASADRRALALTNQSSTGSADCYIGRRAAWSD